MDWKRQTEHEPGFFSCRPPFSLSGWERLWPALSCCIFLPASVVFLGQSPGETWSYALLALILVDVGMTALGSLLGALSQGQAARESLLSIVLFPLTIPVLLAGIQVCASGFGNGPAEDSSSWLGIAAAFDGVFLAAGLLLFPYVFSGDE